MRNLIIAIVAVGFLQVSFQIYMAFDRSDTKFWSMNESDSGVPVNDTPLAELPEISVDTVSLPTVAKRTKHLQAIYRKSEITLAVDRRKTLVKDPKSGTVAVVSRTIESIPSSKSRGISPSTIIKAEEPPKQQNSLIAKVLPVIKKPYVWLKTLAIRLK